MRKRLTVAIVWIVAGGTFAASEACSALVARYIPILNIHWIIKPILGIANAPSEEGYLGTSGMVARLLHAVVVVLAAVVLLWVTSKGASPTRSALYKVGQGLFIGGTAANAYQLLVTGRVLDWITFRPLAAFGMPEGLTTYSLGDAEIASGFAILMVLVLLNTQRTSMSRLKKHETGR
jgi:lipoprotein signal peptidase